MRCIVIPQMLMVGFAVTQGAEEGFEFYLKVICTAFAQLLRKGLGAKLVIRAQFTLVS